MKWMKVDEMDEWNCKSEIAETQHPTDRCYQYHIHVGFGRVKEENQLDKLQARQTSYISRVCCPLADNFDEMKQINKSQLSTKYRCKCKYKYKYMQLFLVSFPEHRDSCLIMAW